MSARSSPTPSATSPPAYWWRAANCPLASVRLSHPIPKKEIFRVMEVINTVRLQAPTAVGQVALADVCGLGADVIVTKNVARANA